MAAEPPRLTSGGQGSGPSAWAPRVAGFSPQEGTGHRRPELEGGARYPGRPGASWRVGVAPDTHPGPAEAGLALGAQGKRSAVDGLDADTSAPDVYAVGDAVEVRHFVTGAKRPHLRWPARPTSRAAWPPTTSAAGASRLPRGARGTSVLKLCDLTVASTGLNEKSAAGRGPGL